MYLSCSQVDHIKAWIDQSPSLVHSTHELPHPLLAVHAVKSESKSSAFVVSRDTESGNQISLSTVFCYSPTLALLYFPGVSCWDKLFDCSLQKLPKRLINSSMESTNIFCPKILQTSCFTILAPLFPLAPDCLSWSFSSSNRLPTLKDLPQTRIPFLNNVVSSFPFWDAAKVLY